MDTSVLVVLSSNSILILMTCVLVSVVVLFLELSGGKQTKINNKIMNMRDAANKSIMHRPPGPKPYPIVGNLPCLDGYEVPYQAFDDLAKQYGSIISLRLGSVPTVVVNGIDNIKEVLIAKASHFDSRPNFRRYHDLFSGNKQNCKYFFILFLNHLNTQSKKKNNKK